MRAGQSIDDQPQVMNKTFNSFEDLNLFLFSTKKTIKKNFKKFVY